MDPMVPTSPTLQSAVVTLDVLHSGVIWGWFVTMNFWAKSLSTGAVLVGAWMAHRHPDAYDFYRRWLVGLGLVFLTITLVFTVGDLHQPLRFWHLFVYGNPASAVAWGAWLLTAYNVVLVALAFVTLRRDRAWMDRLLGPAIGVAFVATIYTAALLGQANAREIWSTPTEVAQTLLSAVLCGSAVYLLFPRPEAERRDLAQALGLSAMLSLTIFVGELGFAPMKSEEARLVVHLLVSGPLASLMLPGLTLAFLVPMGLAAAGVRLGSPNVLRAAAVVSLIGLWMVKHAFLVAPQLVPLS